MPALRLTRTPKRVESEQVRIGHEERCSSHSRLRTSSAVLAPWLLAPSTTTARDRCGGECSYSVELSSWTAPPPRLVCPSQPARLRVCGGRWSCTPRDPGGHLRFRTSGSCLRIRGSPAAGRPDRTVHLQVAGAPLLQGTFPTRRTFCRTQRPRSSTRWHS